MRLVGNPTRDQILMQLKLRGRQRIDALATALRISNAGVRQQLASLLAEGLVGVTPVRQVTGRPAHVYGLTDKGDALFPRDYAAMLLGVLERLKQTQGMQVVEELLAAHVDEHIQRLLPAVRGKPLRERLDMLVQSQQQRGYMVELTSRRGEPDCLQHNCIYKRVASAYTVLCQQELRMYRTLLETEVNLRECIAKGDSFCRFEIVT